MSQRLKKDNRQPLVLRGKQEYVHGGAIVRRIALVSQESRPVAQPQFRRASLLISIRSPTPTMRKVASGRFSAMRSATFNQRKGSF